MLRKLAAAGRGVLPLLLAGLAGPGRLEATQITWASNALATNLQSDGTALDDTFVFFLGTFASGFTPTAANTGQWAAQWSTLEATAYNPVSMRFAESTDYTVNAAPFLTGVRGYIWGTNGRYGAGEWILLTNPAWTFPAGAGGPGAATVTWTAGQASQVILGAVGASGVHLRTAATGAAAPPVLAPAAWRALTFTAAELLDPAVSGWEADPDGDGASNLMEYATGTPAKSGQRRATPELAVVSGGTRMELSLERDCRAQALWLPEESSTLSGWIPAAADIQQDPFSLSGFRLGIPLLPGNPRFVRFKWSLP